jgi:hypothetical protein
LRKAFPNIDSATVFRRQGRFYRARTNPGADGDGT